MESFRYHGHRVEHEPQELLRDVPAGSRDHWFNVYDEDDNDAFRLRMRVNSIFAHFRGADVRELAQDLGIRWVRGLIDLGRYTRGETYYEDRLGEWDSSFGLGAMDEDRLRLQILSAAERTTRIEMRTGAIDGISVLGIADVLGVPTRAVQDVLAGLLLEGLIEPYVPTADQAPIQGACRITAQGAQALRQLRERLGQHASRERSLWALMFTDIVKSTQHLANAGDDVWSRQLEAHYRESRLFVEQFGGQVVNQTGDGILAAFEMPSTAVECALGLRARLADLHLKIRAAVHFGEVNFAQDEVSGISVHVASRVLGESDGRVVVTEAVREMSLGSRVRFQPIGERALRDVPGTWRLYEAALRD